MNQGDTIREVIAALGRLPVRGLVTLGPGMAAAQQRDQNDNAVRVTTRGAGLSLPRQASADEIEKAVRQLLNEPGYREAAQSLGAAIRRDAERLDASSRIEDLAYEMLALRWGEQLLADIAS